MPGVPHEAWEVYPTDQLAQRLWKRICVVEGELAAGRISTRTCAAMLREVRLGLGELNRRFAQQTLC